jgi:uncharacterized protein YcgI (DUF1989 family)
MSKIIYSKTLDPVSGKAIPMKRGQTLTITLLEGPQCVDFNCFGLHDYKERMSVGHMRRTGFRCRQGSIVWSAPPRYNPMMVFTELPATCRTDLLAARCHATQFEKERGYPGTHTNCQDTLAESIAEFGLTPDDVHDSLNLWMNTGWDDEGNFIPNVRRNQGKKGDQVKLLALMDVLAVPLICGSGDVSNTSNYWFRSIKVEVTDNTPADDEIVATLLKKHTGFINQRTPDQFRIKDIKTDRDLTATDKFVPKFTLCPVPVETVTVQLSESDKKNLAKLVKRGFGEDDEDALRSAVMTWYTRNRTAQIVPETLDIE